MAETAFYRKYRSQTFADLVGQGHVTRTLLNALKQGRVGHAYLFCGPRGIGKTSIARLLAKAINCETNEGRGEPCNECRICRNIAAGRCMDVLEIDAASNTGVDNIRDLRDKLGYAPSEARYKVYIIDEVHRLSANAFDALLKSLEEPPPHVKFFFASTERHRIPATILSRCQRFDLKRIPLKEAVARLAYICQAEAIEAEPAALELIARAATGSLRDAESLLDQLASMAAGPVTLEDTQALLGLSGGEGSADLARAVAERDVAGCLRQIDRLGADGADMRALTADLIEYLRGLLLIRSGSGADMLDVPEHVRADMAALAARFELGDLVRVLRLLNELDLAPRTTTNPQLPLELALIETITGPSRPVSAAQPVPAAAPSAPLASRARTAPPEARAQFTPPAARAATPAETVVAAASAPPALTRTNLSPQPAVAVLAAEGAPASEGEPARAPAPAASAQGDGVGEPPVAVGASASGSVGDGPTLADVQARWRQFVAAFTSDRPLQAVLRDGVPEALDGGALAIGFRSTFHRDSAGGAKNLPKIEAALSDFFGVPLRVRCTLLTGNGAKPRADILQDALVKETLSRGGRIKRVVREGEE